MHKKFEVNGTDIKAKGVVSRTQKLHLNNLEIIFPKINKQSDKKCNKMVINTGVKALKLLVSNYGNFNKTLFYYRESEYVIHFIRAQCYKHWLTNHK